MDECTFVLFGVTFWRMYLYSIVLDKFDKDGVVWYGVVVLAWGSFSGHVLRLRSDITIHRAARLNGSFISHQLRSI